MMFEKSREVAPGMVEGSNQAKIEIRDLAVRCGEIFGLALYGLDVLETPRGPFVVDVNPFPGYGGCPGAAEAVADVIAAYATGRRDVAAPPPEAGLPGGAGPRGLEVLP